MQEVDLKKTIQETANSALRSQDKKRLGVIRLIQAAIKQKEVDERIELSKEQILTILDKMLAQRRESIRQYEKANRQDLVTQEAFEIELINEFLPTPLTEVEIQAMIKNAITEVKATSVKDMSQVMTVIKPLIKGRADPSVVGNLVKNFLQ